MGLGNVFFFAEDAKPDRIVSTVSNSSTPPGSSITHTDTDVDPIDKGIIPNIAKGYEPRLQTINEGVVQGAAALDSFTKSATHRTVLMPFVCLQSLDMDFLAEKTRETYKSLSTLQNLTGALEDSSKAFAVDQWECY